MDISLIIRTVFHNQLLSLDLLPRQRFPPSTLPLPHHDKYRAQATTAVDGKGRKTPLNMCVKNR